jgi:L-asparagine oxygenase
MVLATGRRATPPAVLAPAFALSLPATNALDADFVRAAGHAARLLPAEIHDALVDFIEDAGPAGAMVLRGLPIGRVPVTPPRPGAHTAKDRTSEFTLLTVARRLGHPVGYVQEHGGGLVQDIVPARDAESRQLSTSSSVTLEWHTETAFHPHKPRYLLLLCLRGDPDAQTMLCSIAHVLPHLDASTTAVLREPRFRTGPDASFLEREGAGAGELGPPMAVLAGDPERPTFTYDEDLMVGIDVEAQAALDRVGEAVRACATSVVLEPGDLLIVDNHYVVHARSPFPARFDGTDRWLQRAFVVSDLSASAAERTGRIITTRF